MQKHVVIDLEHTLTTVSSYKCNSSCEHPYMKALFAAMF